MRDERDVGVRESPYKYRRDQSASRAGQAHKRVNDRYLRNREKMMNMPTMEMVDQLTESEVDHLTILKEKQVVISIKQNEAMMEMLDRERKREIERQRLIKRAPDMLTKEEMKLRFIVERDHAAKQIKELAKKHRLQIERIFQNR